MLKKIKVLVYLETYLEYKVSISRGFSLLEDAPVFSLVNNPSVEVKILCSDKVLEQAKNLINKSTGNLLIKRKSKLDAIKKHLICIPHNELLKICDDYSKVQSILYKEKYNHLYDDFKKVYMEHLGNFIPDIILSWESPTKHLQYMFPKAKVLNFYWHPVYRGSNYIVDNSEAIYTDGLLSKYYNEIKKLKIDYKKANKLIPNINLNPNQKHKETIDKLRKKFDNIVILFIPVIDFFAIKENLEKDIHNVIDDVFKQVGCNTGVIVSQHPSDLRDYKDYLKKYNNNIFLDNFYKNTKCDLYIPYVDAIYSAISSIYYKGAITKKTNYYMQSTTIPLNDYCKSFYNNQDNKTIASNNNIKVNYFLFEHLCFNTNKIQNNVKFINKVLYRALFYEGIDFYVKRQNRFIFLLKKIIWSLKRGK